MRICSKALLCAFAMGGALVLTAVADAKPMNYPAHGKAAAVIDVPDNWKVTPANDAGDWANMESPGGTVLELRTVEGKDETMMGALDETHEYIKKNYSDLKLQKEKVEHKVNGLKGAVVFGTGKEKDGTPVNIMTMAIEIKTGDMAEFWYVAPESDKAGMADAAKIMDTFMSK